MDTTCFSFLQVCHLSRLAHLWNAPGSHGDSLLCLGFGLGSKARRFGGAHRASLFVWLRADLQVVKVVQLHITTFSRMPLQGIFWLAILPAFFAQHLNPTGVAAIVGNGHSRVLTWHFAQAREVLQLRPRSGGFCLEDVPPLTSLCSFTTFGPFKTQRRVANGRTFYGTYISIEAVIKGSSKSSLVGLILWGAVSSNRIKAGLLPSEVSSPALSGLRQAPPRRLSCQSTV